MTIESTGTVPAPEIDRRRVAELTAQQRQLLTERTPNSGAYFERARKVMPKGVPSSFQENDPWPVYIERGHGAQVWDVDGNEYIDFHNGFGVMCIGHANPQVAEAVKRRVDLGTHFAAPTEGSIQVAEELRSRFRLPQWRFTNSGTESTMDAIHVARGATGRDMILKIEGSYHGHHDAVMVSVYPELEELGDRDDPISVPYGAGYPRAITELTRSVPFNDAQALAKVLERLDGQVAALIMEPAMMNINIVPPVDGYLDDVRRITSEHGVVLIFDEVKTGATISPGGATQRFGVTPDIVTLAKASCGGLPGGSIGMTEELAAVIADGTVHQYGTFNGNPLVMAAAHATLTEVLTTPAYMQFETTNDILRRGCEELIEKYGLPCYTEGLGAKGCVVFASEPLREYRDYLTKVDDDLSTLAWLYHMNHGIFMTPGVEEEWTLSVAHTHEHVQRYLDAFEAFAKDLTGERDVAMANRLADETSPYLLQHKDNPVDWYPWGEEALARAKAEDKPLLVSIGYSACHWCHVMEHESFEDPDTAAVLNEHFVPVKVDREERPDVDTIYMGAVQAMTGHGGWPLNVFVDPDGVPFYGGTYFPPEQRQGMPSFRQVLEGVSEAWQTRREEIKAAAPQTIEGLSATSRLRPAEEEPASQELEEAEHGLAAQFDPNFGGFGGAPKFPPASALEFLMARIADGAAADTGRATEIVRTTLERMARGGIYDQVGGGFARYAVDAHWLVPHFEKMLYDNALLARAYLHAWQLTGDERFRRVCEETLDWALREMRGPEGGFYSALDADSEGEEGKFYVWSEQELRDILGEDADAVLRYWGVDRGPNFEGRSILYEEGGDIDPEVLARARQRLYDVRAQRVWPGLDDKRLTAWNALMLAALADAGAVLGRGDYLDSARQCAEFLTGQMRDVDGRLLRTYKDGRASLNAYLEDHAFLSEALLVLYEATLETRWFVEARALADDVVLRFRDPEGGGFFDTASDHESLVVRPRSFEDHPIPAGSSSAAYALLRIFAVTGDRAYERPAVEVFRLLHQAAVRHPQAFGHLLQAMHFHFSSPREVALVGERFDELAAAVHRRFHPTVALAGMRPGDEAAIEAIPLLRGREPVDGRPAAYVCENFTCRMPVTDPEELDRLLA